MVADPEWSKALRESEGGREAKVFQQKMMGLSSKGRKSNNERKLEINKNLLDWLVQEGNVHLSDQSTWGEAPHPLAISTDTVDEMTNESSGRGLLARRDINEGDELVVIPFDLCLTKRSARRAFGGRDGVLPPRINEYLAVACQLIREKYVLKETSFYKPYMDILPNVGEVNPTFTWSDEDLTFLDGSPVIVATRSLQLKLKREYDALLGNEETGFIAKYPDLFPKEHYTYDNWVWAFTMLFSRAIRLRNMKAGETLAMVPYADLINHSPQSGAYVDGRLSGDWLFKTGKEEVILYAERGYRMFEQVFISYGPKSNADLLLLYGFAVERNPFNSVDVTVSITARTSQVVDDEVDPLAEEKIEFLRKVGRDNSIDFPCYADRYPIEMLEYLRLMQMTTEDTAGKPLYEFDYSNPISPANEAAVLTSIVYAVERQLSKYPTTEEQDAMIIKDKPLFRTLTYNQRMAVRHRRNEKRLLKRTIAALQKQLQTKGLDNNKLERAQGNVGGDVLPGDEARGDRARTALEQRLEEMGLPVDLR